jgi:hypothetical protein
MSAVAKSLTNVVGYARRWQNRVAKRFNRIYDDRDMALADALKLLEEKSPSYYPPSSTSTLPWVLFRWTRT